jgi:hypothetical protein
MIAANVRGGMNASDVRRRMCRSTLPSRAAISANSAPTLVITTPTAPGRDRVLDLGWIDPATEEHHRTQRRLKQRRANSGMTGANLAGSLCDVEVQRAATLLKKQQRNSYY